MAKSSAARMKVAPAAEAPASAPPKQYSAIVGTLVERGEDGALVVEFAAGDAEVRRCLAVATVEVAAGTLGHPVLLMFLGGDLERPVITGVLQPGSAAPRKLSRTRRLEIDGRELVLEADSQLTLRCGKSSITLTRDGKVVIRGTNLVSRASSTNRIRGGTIALN